MSVKNPNPSTVSRTISAKANGYTVTSEHGRDIYHALRTPGQAPRFRFPVAKVVTPEADVDDVAEKLNAAGYHAEAHTLQVRPYPSAEFDTYRVVIVLSQEDIDDRAAREERVANAQAVAEELVPRTARIKIRRKHYPSHEADTFTLSRAEVVGVMAGVLGDPGTDVLTEDGVTIERDYTERRDPRVTGLVVYPDAGGREVYLFFPVDEPETPAAEPIEGVIVAHGGAAMGTEPRHVNDSDVRAAIELLTAAGHIPADVADEYDPETSTANGFFVAPRAGGVVYVYHLIGGQMQPKDSNGGYWPQSKEYRRLFRRTPGWESLNRAGASAQARRVFEQPAPGPVAAIEGPIPAEDFTPEQVEGARAILREVLAEAAADAPAAERLAPGTRVRHVSQQWATEVIAPEGTAVVVAVGLEHHDGTCEYEVLAGADFSRRVGPDNPMTRKTEWNSAAVVAVAAIDGPISAAEIAREVLAEAAAERFEVRRVSAETYGVWDLRTDLWNATRSTKEAAQDAADGLNSGRLGLDALGRIKDPQGPDSGLYVVYSEPDEGYAPDADRETLAEAQQVAEDTATQRGLNPRGVGYHWECDEAAKGHSVWTLRSVYDWAKRTGISVEGPTPPRPEGEPARPGRSADIYHPDTARRVEHPKAHHA